MVVYTLEQCWEILRHYFENHGNVGACVRKLRQHHQLRMFIILWKKWKKLTSSGRTPENIAAVTESVCEPPSTSIHRRSQQLNISETPLTRILHKDLGTTPYKVHLVQQLKSIDHPMRFRFAKWACDRFTEDADFGKKKNHLFIWSSFWSWRICKQAKLLHLGHRKPARIHWIADAPKTSHCLVRNLVQRHNCAIFLWKWASRGRYSQWRSLSGHVKRIFVRKNWREGYWQHLVSTGRRCVPHSRSYTRCFATCFCRLHYQPQGWCRLASSELRFDTVGLLFVGCHQR